MKITKEQAIEKIAWLVERFEEQKESYLSPGYNETLTRRDFIDPFFKALGWDIDNENGYAESYREVIHEDRVKTGKSTKAPDYSFRLAGGKRLFFVEAKKPSVYIQGEVLPAYQVRRYGWSAKLPISIITDFEEFAVYDCTKRPNSSDKASTARLKYLTFKDYVSNFDYLWEIFSKEKVLKGSFDRYVKSDSHKRGTATVDSEFLQSLDKWREQLAVNISYNNHELDEDEINFSVQQLIDRIIFLRIAEDRNVEPYENLKSCLKGGHLYQNLLDVFERADEKYNSGLFDFEKDRISKRLRVDDRVVKSIILDLYYPECPYAFSVLPVEILGTAYEQFLGKQIKITSGRNAYVEEKPEVRKAGGVYYTPDHIVRYIVGYTVGNMIKGKTPAEISKLRIVDPACGSGSFLLGAYEYLLNYHRNYYSLNSKTSKGSRKDVLTPQGELTTAEKKRILLNNIYGVDLDANAVEVTKLSLLIKCLEGETEASIAQMKLFHERILPTLDNNIRNGNSLVGVDVYNDLDTYEDKRIKPFSWERSFPEVFKAGGFDVVIGNPPYVQLKSLSPDQQLYLERNFVTGVDLFSVFIEKSIQLLKDNSPMGFIVPSLFIKGIRYQALRDFINKYCSEAQINEQGDGVFAQVSMPTSIVLLKKGKPKKQTNYFVNENAALFEKVPCIKLGDISEIRRGLEIGKDKLQDHGSIPCLTGSNLGIYRTKGIRYITSAVLKNFSKDMDIFRSPKIMVRETGGHFFSSLDQEGYITTRSIYNVRISSEDYTPEFVLGIINSRFFLLYFKTFIAPDTKVFPKIRIAQLKQLPLPAKADAKAVKTIHESVSQIMKIRNEAAKTLLNNKKDELLSKVDFLLDKIDDTVYSIYGLNAHDIRLVKGELAQYDFE